MAAPTATDMDLDDDDDDDNILGMTCELAADDVDTEEDTTERDADNVFKKWMSHTVKISRFVFNPCWRFLLLQVRYI